MPKFNAQQLRNVEDMIEEYEATLDEPMFMDTNDNDDTGDR